MVQTVVFVCLTHLCAFLWTATKIPVRSPVQGIQLAAGRPTKQRKPQCVQVEQDLWSAKDEYGLEIGYVFSSVYPNASSCQLFKEATVWFLNRASYLLGCDKGV